MNEYKRILVVTRMIQTCRVAIHNTKKVQEDNHDKKNASL